MIRMLCLFDYGKNVNTGYATVSRNLVSQWKQIFGKNIQIDIVAINYFGEPYKEDVRTSVNNAMFPAKDNPAVFPEFIDEAKKIRNDEFGTIKYLKMLDEGQYNVAFVMNDVGVLSKLAAGIRYVKEKRAKEGRKTFKIMAYYPVDCHLYPELVKDFSVYDKLVTYTNFGKQETLKCNPNLKISVLPHGTNLKDFYPVNDVDVRMFRKEYFGKEISDKYIVGNINRNQPRKDIPATIFGFMNFKAEVPDAVLYLHMNPKDPMGYDIPQILAQTPLIEGKDVIFMNKEDQEKGCPVEKLNMIYNSLDLFVTTNRGEGYGLTISESMSCGVPVVAPMHTSIPELSDNGKNIYPLTEFALDCIVKDNIIRYKCNDDEVGEMMLQAYNERNTPEIREKVDRAYKFISEITWEKTAGKFAEYIENLL